MEEALDFITGSIPLADSREESFCSNKLALSPCSTPYRFGTSIVFDNATFVGDAVVAEFAYQEESSHAYWDEQMLYRDNAMVRMDWNVSDSHIEKHTPLPLASSNVVVLLQHALKQGLSFKLQGIGLGDMLGQTVKSTKLLLASSRLTRLVKGGKELCNTGYKKDRILGGSKLGAKVLQQSDATNRLGQNTSSGSLVVAADGNELHTTAQTHTFPSPIFAKSAEGPICKSHRLLHPRSEHLEGFSHEDAGMQSHSAPTRSSSCSITLDGGSKACGPTIPLYQNQDDADVVFKQCFPEITPGHTHDDQLSGYTIPPPQKISVELKESLSTRETNSNPTEFIQDFPRSINQVRPENLEQMATCKLSHVHSDYFKPKFEQSLPKCNFSAQPGAERKVYPSGQRLNIHQEWLEQSANYQVPIEPFRWAQQNLVERNVRAGFPDSDSSKSLQHSWSHSPVCRYQCAPEKCPKPHSYYATYRFNPLAQSCPSFVQPPVYPHCQQILGRHHLSNNHLMVFPEEGKPLRSLAAASCSPCLLRSEEFLGSTPVCQAQNDNVLQSYQCSSPALSDCLQRPSSEYFHGPTSFEHPHTDKCGGPPSKLKSKNLLWLSEEEAEIIRLIRLSQVKDLSRCSSSYHASEQESPVLSARTGPEIQEEVNLNEARGASHVSSRVSSFSMEDFASKAVEAGVFSLGSRVTKCMLPSEDEQSFPIDADCITLVCDEKQTNKEVSGHTLRAASCIQYFWRKHVKRKNRDLEEKKRLEALKFIFEMPTGQEHLLQMAVTAMKNGQLVSWHASINRAAVVIQHAWQGALRRKKERMLAPNTLPQESKELYKLIVWRQKNNGLTPPSYEKFVGLMERLQATTEGARIRRRLKSRRLQTIVKEIREIRVVLQELSSEAGLEPPLNLLPQLSMHLQQKLLQLRTALSGPQDAARVLLRRCPATPLVLCSSKNAQAESTGSQSPSAVGDTGSLGYPVGKSSIESFSGSQKPGVVGHSLGKLLTESNASLQKSKHHTHPRSSNFSEADNYGNHDSPLETNLRPPILASSWVGLSKSDSSEKSSVPAKEKIEKLRDRSIYERRAQVERPSVVVRSAELNVKKESTESSAIRKTDHAIEQWQNRELISFEERASDISSVKSCSLHAEDSDYEDMSQNLDVPKHPFLRRKSKAMPPQKLDWSKVKPMVSSRLEPELKTRLLKAKFRGTALFRKRNFSEIKSRLFSYEKSGSEENSDIMRDASFRHDGAEHVGVHKKGSSTPEFAAEIEPGDVNKSACNPKVHSSKQPSLRYFCNEGLLLKDGTKEIEEAESQRNLLARSPQKLRAKRTEKHPEASFFDTACKGNEFGAVENQPKRGHSRRYENPKKSSDLRVSEASLNVSANHEGSQPRKRGDICFSHHILNQVEQPLSELEKMFDDVIARQGRDVSLATYFGSNQQDSIIPRLYPNSNVFETSHQKMSQIHQLLSKEGCAGRLQHNCLSFVSIRD